MLAVNARYSRDHRAMLVSSDTQAYPGRQFTSTFGFTTLIGAPAQYAAI